MDDQPRSPALVAALVEAIDSRAHHETDWVIRALVCEAWPAGHSDRRDPTAAEWVRRWGPARIKRPYGADCSCALGRCLVCN
jgi:hypothetical protein